MTEGVEFNPGGAQAFVRQDMADGKGYAHAEARTRALALCIACLRARQHKGEGK